MLNPVLFLSLLFCLLICQQGFSRAEDKVQSTTVGTEVLFQSGLLSVGTQIGNCEIISSELLLAAGENPVLGMEIKVQQGSKTVTAYLASKITASYNRIFRSDIIESRIKLITDESNPIVELFRMKNYQYVKVQDKGRTFGNKRLSLLAIETKTGNFFSEKSTVPEQSLICQSFDRET